jgi:hypothetical protein
VREVHIGVAPLPEDPVEHGDGRQIAAAYAQEGRPRGRFGSGFDSQIRADPQECALWWVQVLLPRAGPGRGSTARSGPIRMSVRCGGCRYCFHEPGPAECAKTAASARRRTR